MATLLPPAVTQFFDGNGVPLAGGSVYFYVPNTTTPKDTWSDSGQSILNTNPIILNAAGENPAGGIYGSGIYRQVIYDSAGNLIWDDLTASTDVGGIIWGDTSGGSANAQTLSSGDFSSTAGQQISFIAGFTNTGATTLTVGTSSAIPILLDSGAGPVALAGGEIHAGNEITVVYDASRGAFHLVNPAYGVIAGATISGSTILLKQATDPAPTAEGDLQWSTLFGHFKVGHASATDRFLPGPAPGALYGCSIANNAGDATNSIDFAAGQAADSTNAFYLIASAITKSVATSWAVGTGQGGLFSGSVANTTYHCFIIMRPDTGVVDAGFDTSVTAANRPAAYTYFRRVGSIVRSGGAIVAFLQSGNFFTLAVAVDSVHTTNPGTSAVTATLNVPTGLVVNSVVGVRLYDGTPATSTNVLVTSLAQPDTTPSSSVATFATPNSGASTPALAGAVVQLFTNTSGQVRYRIDVSDTDHIVDLTTFGWIDFRGTV